jgi:carbamoyltransferase
MLFDHRVAEPWTTRVPAICHLDGTARLQTVSPEDAADVFEVVAAYAEASGIPVLCNTSANRPGCGFFPDAASAMEWGGTNYVWCDGQLFERREKTAFPELRPCAAF